MFTRGRTFHVLLVVVTMSAIAIQYVSTTHTQEVCRRSETLKILASSVKQKQSNDDYKVYPGGIFLKTEDRGDTLQLSFKELDSVNELIFVHEGVSEDGELLRSINGTVGTIKPFLAAASVYIEYDWAGSNVNFVVLCRSMQPEERSSWFPSWAWIILFAFIGCVAILTRVLWLCCRRRGMEKDNDAETKMSKGKPPVISVISFKVHTADGEKANPALKQTLENAQYDNVGEKTSTDTKPPSYCAA